jgi:hypothetical protein
MTYPFGVQTWMPGALLDFLIADLLPEVDNGIGLRKMENSRTCAKPASS